MLRRYNAKSINALVARKQFIALRFSAAARAGDQLGKNVNSPITQPYNTPLSAGIGNGQVCPLQFDYHRPVYMVPSFAKIMMVLTPWFWYNVSNPWIFAFCVIFGLWGGFTGHVPPDPHTLHN